MWSYPLLPPHREQQLNEIIRKLRRRYRCVATVGGRVLVRSRRGAVVKSVLFERLANVSFWTMAPGEFVGNRLRAFSERFYCRFYSILHCRIRPAAARVPFTPQFGTYCVYSRDS